MLLILENAELRQGVCERLDLDLVLVWNGELEEPVGNLCDVLDAGVRS